MRYALLIISIAIYSGQLFGQIFNDKNQSIVVSDTLVNDTVTIEKIYILGNKKTKDHIILRELRFSDGDRVSLGNLNEFIERDRNRIYNTRLFNKVTIDILENGNDFVQILIRVEERWYTFPLPIFELADRNFNDWWTNQNRDFSRVEYGIRFYQYNMRGRNERLRVTAQFGFTKLFDVEYTFPYINKGRKNGLSVFFQYLENKNISYQTVDHKLVFLDSEETLRELIRASVKFTHRETFYNYHNLSLEFEATRINDTIPQLNPNYLADSATSQRVFVLEYHFRRDYRDLIAYPLNGYLFDIKGTKRGLGIFDDLNQTILYSRFVKFINLKNGFYFSNRTAGQISFPKNPPYNKFQAFGYNQEFVRGFELNVIDGQNYILNKATLKKQLFKTEKNLGKAMPLEQFRTIPIAVYLNTYFDIGQVDVNFLYPDNSRLSNKFIYGGGLGLDIVTYYDAVLRLEYSINSEQETGFFIHFKADI